jgi:hypothetical protein
MTGSSSFHCLSIWSSTLDGRGRGDGGGSDEQDAGRGEHAEQAAQNGGAMRLNPFHVGA